MLLGESPLNLSILSLLQDISTVIAYARSHGFFSMYSARITLHQAHLAHALGQTERALKCYQVAAFLSRQKNRSPSKRAYDASEEEEGCEDYWVNVSARAGELWLCIGLASTFDDETEWAEEMEVLRKEGVKIVKECEGLGGTMQAVGAVLTASLSKEFLVAKYAPKSTHGQPTDPCCRTQLRTALNLSSAAQDNHLRALVLALIAAQYVHTSAEHAENMLNTAEQLAAGLGAQSKAITEVCSPRKQASVAAGDGVGNVHLRWWIGERSLGLYLLHYCLLHLRLSFLVLFTELKRRAGNEESVLKQTEINRRLEHAMENLKKRTISQIS
jgi:hypothetical protein